jgi:hypothetical protein
MTSTPLHAIRHHKTIGAAVVLAIAVGVLLGACSDTPTAMTPVDNPEPQPAPVDTYVDEPDAEPVYEPTKAETDAVAMQLVWDTYTASDQIAMCTEWISDPDWALSQFMSGAGPEFTEAVAVEFFDDKCRL